MFRWLLFPFSLLFGIAVWFRNKFFDLNILPFKEFNLPIIVVGNITVGGTGKTPHIEYLIKSLQETHQVAVLSRGYKRETNGFLVATNASTSAQVGDEPRQIKRKFPDVGMVVDGNRVRAIEKLMKGAAGFDPDVILLDDAFQHRYVKPGLSILLVDYNQPLKKDHLLPYGRLRESVYEKKRANIVIVTKAPKELKPIERRIIEKEMKLFPYQKLYFTYLKYGELTPIFDSAPDLSIKKAQDLDVKILLLTGIANPAPLHQHLKEKFKKVEHIQFCDHRNYTNKDVKRIIKEFDKIEAEKKIIITTEKDAVRILDSQPFKESLLPIYYIPIEVGFLNEDKTNFKKKIFTYISNNKRR